jgi:hypothetical protein
MATRARQDPASGAVTGIGLKKVKGEEVTFNKDAGWLAKWEPMEKNGGQQGLAVIVDPKLLEKQTEDQKNLLLAIVLAYPYLPGSSSDAFKGVSVFIGVKIWNGLFRHAVSCQVHSKAI